MTREGFFFARFFAALAITATALESPSAYALRPVGLEESNAKADLTAGLEEGRTYYEILGVDPQATRDEMTRAYRKLAKQWHPDLNPERREEAEEQMKRITQAYWVLSNSSRRLLYDENEMGFILNQSDDRVEGAAQFDTPWSRDLASFIEGLISEQERTLRDVYGRNVTVVRHRARGGTRFFTMMWDSPHYDFAWRRCVYGIRLVLGDGTDVIYELASIRPAPTSYPSLYYTITRTYSEGYVSTTRFARRPASVAEDPGGFRYFAESPLFSFGDYPDQYLDVVKFKGRLQEIFAGLVNEGLQKEWLHRGWLEGPLEKFLFALHDFYFSGYVPSEKEKDQLDEKALAVQNEIPGLSELLSALYNEKSESGTSDVFWEKMELLVRAINGALLPRGYRIRVVEEESGERRLVLDESPSENQTTKQNPLGLVKATGLEEYSLERLMALQRWEQMWEEAEASKEGSIEILSRTVLDQYPGLRTLADLRPNVIFDEVGNLALIGRGLAPTVHEVHVYGATREVSEFQEAVGRKDARIIPILLDELSSEAFIRQVLENNGMRGQRLHALNFHQVIADLKVIGSLEGKQRLEKTVGSGA